MRTSATCTGMSPSSYTSCRASWSFVRATSSQLEPHKAFARASIRPIGYALGLRYAWGLIESVRSAIGVTIHDRTASSDDEADRCERTGENEAGHENPALYEVAPGNGEARPP